MNKIEEIYQEMCNRSNPLYFSTYSLVKSRLEKSYFPYLRDVQPFKTDHGIGHVDRILEKFSHFLNPHLPVSGNPRERIIDLENLNLLMHAVLWHDLGNLFGRIDHPQNIKKVFNGVKSFLYEPPHQEWILKVAEGHSGAESIERKIEDTPITIYDYTIYPRFLSALLRISDEIDEDQRRVESRVFSNAPRECEAYWKFCLFTESIIPVYRMDSLGNVDLDIQIRCKMGGKDIKGEWGKNGSMVTAINEYISRVNKINEERIYCNKFLQQYSALYFRKIEKIRTEITIISDENEIADRISFDFTDDRKKDDFFEDDHVEKTLKKHIGG